MARFVSAAVMSIGGLVFLEWAFGRNMLSSLYPGLAFFAAAGLIVTGVAVWWVTVTLDRIDHQRRHAEDLYENAPDAMASIDVGTGRILDCNRALQELSGRTKDELLGCEVFELYHPESLSDARRALES